MNNYYLYVIIYYQWSMGWTNEC